MGCSQIESKKPVHSSNTKKKNRENKIEKKEEKKIEEIPEIKGSIIEENKTENQKLRASPPLNQSVEISNKGGNISISLEERDNSKINILIPLSNGGKWEKEYNKDEIVEKIIEDFKKENNSIIPPKFNVDWKCNNNPLKFNQKIKDILPKKIPSVILDYSLDTKGLNISKEKNMPEIIGKPLSKPFEICCFNKKKKVIKIIEFNPNEITKNEIDSFGPSSAYCNGNNHLYISGGENNRKVTLSYVWDVDLINKKINKIQKEIEPKKNHSMIFIPNNYVFIIGGNDKKTFYLDINNKEIYPYCDLNFERIEPALILMGDELYCFDNIKKTNSELTFEKTNLKKMPKWELIKPNFDSTISDEKLRQKFFGITKLDDENIIFLGGNMDNSTNNNKPINMNYKYNINTNLIEESKTPFKQINLSEKTFINYDNNRDYILPEFNRVTPEVIFFNKKKNQLDTIHFGQEEIKNPNINLNKKSDKLKNKNPQFNFGLKKNEKFDFNMPQFNEGFDLKVNKNEIEIDKNGLDGNLNVNSKIPNFNNHLNLKNPNLKDPNIKGSNFEGEIPKIEVNNQKKNIKQPKIGKDVNFDLEGKPKKIDGTLNVSSPEFDIEGTKTENFNLDGINGNLNIIPPKINLKDSDIDINSPKVNINGIKIDDNLNPPNLNNNESKVDIKGSKIGGDTYINLEDQIPRINGNVDINSPKVEVNISEKDENIPKVDVNVPKEDIIESKIGENKMLNLKEKIPEIEGNSDINSPKVDVNNPKVDIISPNVDVNDNKIYEPKVDINFPKEDNKEIQIDTNNPKIENNSDINLEGKIPEIDVNLDINSPKVDVKIPNEDIKESKIEGNTNYNLNGRIPEKDGNLDINSPKIEIKNDEKNLDLKNEIPEIEADADIKFPNENIKNPNIEIKGSKISSSIPKPKINSVFHSINNINRIKKLDDEGNYNKKNRETLKGNYNDNEYSGHLLRSSVIESNKNSYLRDSKLPSVEKKKNPKKFTAIGIAGELNNEEIIKRNIKDSFNVGISGKKIGLNIEKDD